MVLTKDELITSLQHEVRVFLHLASKIDETRLDYRPTPGQRSTLDLVRYMVIMGPIHFRAVMADAFDMDAWRTAWRTEEARAKAMSLGEARDAKIGRASCRERVYVLV